jgi:hypothetical protein
VIDVEFLYIVENFFYFSSKKKGRSINVRGYEWIAIIKWNIKESANVKMPNHLGDEKVFFFIHQQQHDTFSRSKRAFVCFSKNNKFFTIKAMMILYV